MAQPVSLQVVEVIEKMAAEGEVLEVTVAVVVEQH